MCWVALDRGARLAELREDWDRASSGGRSPTRSTPTSARTASTSAASSPSTTTPTALDASVLLMPLVRFLPADDERIRATVLAIADELTDDGLVLRYRVEETDDGLSGEEGTFTICSFWLVSALCEIGELDRAPRPVREAALARQPARALRRGDRPAHRPPPRQLPAGVHPPGAHQRRHARDPRREPSSSGCSVLSRCVRPLPRQPADDGRFGRMTAAADLVGSLPVTTAVEVHQLVREFKGGIRAVDGLDLEVRDGRDLRLPRAQRRRQDDRRAHPHHAAAADRGQRARRRPRRRARTATRCGARSASRSRRRRSTR